MSNFAPFDPGRLTPCPTCSSFDGFESSGRHARCLYGGRLHINASPSHGCVFWSRAPGSDDDAQTGNAPADAP